MRFPLQLQWPPIRLVLPLSLLLVSSIFIGSFWWFEEHQAMTDIEQSAMTDKYQDMHHLITQLQLALQGGDKGSVEALLNDFSNEPEIRFVLLADSDGRILASSRPAWVGRSTDDLGEPGAGELTSKGVLNKADQIRLSADGMTIWARFSVALPAAKGERQAHRNGLLAGKFDIRPAKLAARHRIEQWVGLFGAFVLGLAFLFWLVMRYAITRRMNRLIAAANRASRGDFKVRANLLGNDELAQIGAAFDVMIDRLGRETMRQEQLSRAVENMNESVLITDAKGVIQYVNNAFTRITGYAAEEAIGENPRLLKSGRHPPEFYQAFWERISQGKVWKGRMTDSKKDGSLYLSKVSVAPLMDADGRITHYVGVQEDVSEQHKMETQLLQAQKMESLGTLVGGIAHDFNNMLAGMVGNLYMARKHAKDMPEITQKLERVEKLSYRAADMIKQLLAFARKDMVQFRVMDLTPFIKEAFKLSRVVVPENISFQSDVDSQALYVECDATQVQQMLMSLLTNARDALQDVSKPEINLGLHRYQPDAAFIAAHPDATSAAYAMLSVEDNGCGIPEDQIGQIFEPFFTTKGVGQGPGLGLSMVFGAMQRHHGLIEVDSEVGRGSTFRLFFPISGTRTARSTPEEAYMRHGNGERVLVADDEIIVRDTISEMLRLDGFIVDMASDGIEAVELFSAEPDAYDAVILDVVMPRMGGMAAAHKMREIRPDIPVIFSTGYDREHVLRGVEGMQGIASLSKPLHSSTLRRTLIELLGSDAKASNPEDPA